MPLNSEKTSVYKFQHISNYEQNKHLTWRILRYNNNRIMFNVTFTTGIQTFYINVVYFEATLMIKIF